MRDGRFSILRKMLGTSLGAALMMTSANAWAGSCTSGQETALNVKRLQTELMVAALSCGVRADYNSFVRKFQPELAAQGKVLQSLFSETYGGRGRQVLDTHVTSLANQASRGHMEDGRGYCARAAEAFAILSQDSGRATLVRLSSYGLTGGGLGEGPCRARSDLQQANNP